MSIFMSIKAPTGVAPRILVGLSQPRIYSTGPAVFSDDLFSKPPLRSWAELQARQDIPLALLPTLQELDPLLRTPQTLKTKAVSVSKDSNSTPVLHHPSP